LLTILQDIDPAISKFPFVHHNNPSDQGEKAASFQFVHKKLLAFQNKFKVL
jgi:hypothetical protein